MTFNHQASLGDIAARVPSSVAVFERHGLDFCCGGKTTLGDACRAHGLSADTVVAEIEAGARVESVPDRDWTRAPLGELAEHIVSTFHDPLREELPRLTSMAAKVAEVHGAKDARLLRLAAAVGELAGDLQSHMADEESVLFPMVRALEHDAVGAAAVGHPITTLEHEHDRAGALLDEMRALTSGYTVPEWGCNTVRALFGGLSALEQTMHLHVHLENNVMFPRALARAGGESGAR
jgi:regulator of cell morphogenesis and NO signaling